MKKNLLLFIASLFTVYLNAQSANFEWVRQLGGQGEDMPRSLALDASGNIITVGSFIATADFDPGPGTYTLTSLNPWYVFISKLNAQGNFVWAQKLGNTGSSITANAVTTDTMGNVYVTGQFDGNLDFDASLAQQIVTGHWDGYVMKLDPSGNFLWVQVITASNGRGITTDVSGNSYVTGDSFNTIFISKLDATGNLTWNHLLTNTGSDYGASIDVSAQGNVFVTGVLGGTTDFDPGPGVLNLTANGSVDAFILKLTTTGNLVWAKQITGTTDEFGEGIAVDNLENVYSTGTFRSLTDFDPGPGTQNVYPNGFSDSYLSKLDASGNFVWAQQLGGSSGTTFGQAIALDVNKNVYTTGAFFGTVNRCASHQIIPLSTGVYDDIYISMSDSSGNFVWAKQMGGPNHDGGMSIATDASGNIFTTGFFQKTVDFDPDPAIDSVAAFGDRDIYIHKMKYCTTIPPLKLTSNKNPLCIGETATLSATGAVTYTWGSGAVVSATVVSPVYDTFYFLYGTDPNGCVASATLTQYVNACTGIENFAEQLKVNAFPNPTIGNFYVVPGFLFDKCVYELLSPEGRLLEKGQTDSTEKIQFNFSGRNYNPGMYFLRMIFDGNSTVIKFVLQREH